VPEAIRLEETQKDAQGNYEYIRISFGRHYFVELLREQHGKVSFVLGATHHGFKADASEVGGELEKFVNELRRLHPDNSVD
jgi:hypothetical protein